MVWLGGVFLSNHSVFLTLSKVFLLPDPDHTPRTVVSGVAAGHPPQDMVNNPVFFFLQKLFISRFS